MEKYYLNIKINEKIHITLSHLKSEGYLHKTNKKFDIKATKYKSVFCAVFEALKTLNNQTERHSQIDVSISKEYTNELLHIINQDSYFNNESSKIYLDELKNLLKKHSLKYVKNINYPASNNPKKPQTIYGQPKKKKNSGWKGNFEDNPTLKITVTGETIIRTTNKSDTKHNPENPKQTPITNPINSQCKNCIYYNTEDDEGTCSQYDKNKQNCPDYIPSYIHNNKSYRSKKIIIQPKKAR